MVRANTDQIEQADERIMKKYERNRLLGYAPLEVTVETSVELSVSDIFEALSVVESRYAGVFDFIVDLDLMAADSDLTTRLRDHFVKEVEEERAQDSEQRLKRGNK